ncbi:hypothetical protein [Corynebacterium guangdongense]|uniref:Amino acid transporter n=1 Tax=Corynebacterium guangdongense TaxID=1783348 RepID=A0ABU1ZUC2_9CORY|nr:hypothetical protein [Corynebacterium guangdongense]MDR7328522.1 amino acid transporter [Corynebacterium guangdongense]WJZ17099.1 hypothetical protein CGUA_02515 [Corynebacterium guangdongense]
MRTFLVGLILQLVPFVLWVLWGVLPPVVPESFNPWIVIGGIGTVGAVLSLIGVAGVRTSARILGVIFSVIGILGWGSWLLTGVQYGVDEPVINVTGLLVVISTIGLLVVAGGMGYRRPGAIPPPASRS